jgi:SAM-dependent methyltransferase
MKKTEETFKSILNEIENALGNKSEISWFNLHYNRFLETLGILVMEVPRGSLIIDIGCSPGYMTIAAKRLGYQVYGVNPEIDSLRKAIGDKDILIKKCDIEKEKIPFEDSSFDCVLFTEVIEHLNFYHVKFALSEIKRVLKTKGILILSTPNLATLENRLFLLLGGCHYLGGGIINPAHNREYTLSEVTGLLQEADFKIESHNYSIARDVITYAEEDFISREHVLKGFVRHKCWINTGRALVYPLKMLFPFFRSTIFVLARKID